MLRLIRPRYFVPVHGEYRMLAAHAELARQTGVAPGNVFVLEDGDVLILDEGDATLDEPVQAGHVYVDGLRTWDVGEAVLRDRRMLSRDGFVVVVVPIDHATGRVYGEPEIVSSGFTAPEEAEELMERAAAVVVEALRAPNLDPLNEDHVNDRVREALSRFLYKETRSRPMILTVPLEV
jgi:ribonuclease J